MFQVVCIICSRCLYLCFVSVYVAVLAEGENLNKV